MIRFVALALLLVAGTTHAQWQTWRGCRWVENQWNDGDSFRISHQGTETIVRLYFVDTPETDKSNRGADRQVADQAAHFKKSEEEVMHIGRYAKQATAQMLSRPFTVVTRGADARGNSAIGRIFAFVTTADGEDLGEELVRNGLARSFGAVAAPPGKSSQQLRAGYDRLEELARKNKVGIYSPDPLRSIVPGSPSKPRSEGLFLGPEIKIERSDVLAP